MKRSLLRLAAACASMALVGSALAMPIPGYMSKKNETKVLRRGNSSSAHAMMNRGRMTRRAIMEKKKTQHKREFKSILKPYKGTSMSSMMSSSSSSSSSTSSASSN